MSNDLAAPPVVLVTGAGRRIGAAIVEVFHGRGFNVVIHCNRSLVDAGALAERLNNQRTASATVLQADLADIGDVEKLATDAVACFGRLDGLVNNASSFYATPLGTVTVKAWDDLLASNLKGAFFLSQAVAPALRKQQGAIVNIIDIHADQGLKNYPAYSIAKAGLKAMTHCLARELAPRIRVNGVSPGAILWPEDALPDTTAQANILAQIPLGRCGQASDIANTTWFLLQDASYLTGAVIRVDGGRNLNL